MSTSFVSFAQTVSSYYGIHNSRFGIVASAIALDQSASGANATWNFTQLSKIGAEVDLDDMPTPDEISFYPNSTELWVTQNDVTTAQTRTYSRKDGNVVSITAVRNDDALTLNFNTDNATLGSFPMNYGTSNTDTVSGTYVYDIYSGTFTGSITTSVDAYGTLTMNNLPEIGVFSGNVARLKTVLSITLNNSGIPVGTIVQTTYNYYKDMELDMPMVAFRCISTAVDVPVLAIDETTNEMRVFENIQMATSQPEGISKSMIFPNPATAVLNVQSDQKILAVKISDVNGRTVLTADMPENSINISTLQKGIYFANITTVAGTTAQKIIKE